MALSKDELNEIKRLTAEIAQQYKELGQAGESPFDNLDLDKIKDGAQQIEIMKRNLQGLKQEVKELNEDFGITYGILQSISDEMNNDSPVKRMNRAVRSLTNEYQNIKYEQQSGNILSEKQIKKINEKIKRQQFAAKDNAKQILESRGLLKANNSLDMASLHNQIEKGKITKEENQQIQDAINIYKDIGGHQARILKQSKDRVDLEDSFKNKVGLGARAISGLDKALQKAGLPAMGLEAAMAETREEFIRTKNETGKIMSSTETMALFIENAKEKMREFFTFANLAQTAIVMMFKALKEVDQAAGEFAKNQGISYARSVELRGEMAQVALTSKDVLNTSKKLMETQGRLNEIFGQSVVFSDEMADGFTSLNTRLNMSAETQGVFAIEMMKTGKTQNELVKTQTIQTMELNKQKGLQMSVKQIQDAIGKTSKALQLTFKGSSKELTNQVMQAKALGTNMQGVEKIAGHLLDFESSIASELEAELLLGKDINLEKARQAALEGDMGKVAEEVAKQKGIMQAFETKNVIAQEAAAKALGMSRDDLAEMVMEQQKMDLIRKKGFSSMNEAQDEFNKLREQGLTAEQAAKRIGDESLMNQFESASAAERLAAIMEQIQEIFISMAEPILGIVDSIMKMVGGAENLGKILVAIAGTYLIIKGAQLAMKGLQAGQLAFETAKAAIMGTQAVAALTSNAAATFGIGTVIAVGAVAAALGALAAYTFMDDGIIGGRSGYGDRVLLGPEGAIAFNNKDTIVAGTNLFANDMAMAPEGSIDLGGGMGGTEVISVLKDIADTNRKTANKEIVKFDKQLMAKTTENEIVQSQRVIN